jgi:hypothetical protein
VRPIAAILAQPITARAAPRRFHLSSRGAISGGPRLAQDRHPFSPPSAPRRCSLIIVTHMPSR